MKSFALRIGTVGLTLASVMGCSAAPTQPSGVDQVPTVDLPARAELKDLGPEVSESGSAYETQQRRRRYRFRRIIISGVPYFVPYAFGTSYYLPNFVRYDPLWYYVYAYSQPGFYGSRRLIRIRRDRDRDRDWTDRNAYWDRDGRGDWRDGERDGDRNGGGGGYGGRGGGGYGGGGGYAGYRR